MTTTIFILWFTIALLASGISLMRAKKEKNYLSFGICSINIFSFLPILTLMALLFSGGSSVYQLSANNAFAENVWKLWVSLWPICYIGSPLFAAFVLFLLVVSSKKFDRTKDIKKILSLLLTLINLIILFSLSSIFFPDA